MEKSAKSILNKTVFFYKVPVMVNFLAEIVWWFKYQKKKNVCLMLPTCFKVNQSDFEMPFSMLC